MAVPTSHGRAKTPHPPDPAQMRSVLDELKRVDSTISVFILIEWASIADDDNSRLALMLNALARFPELSADCRRDAAHVLLFSARLLKMFARACPLPEEYRLAALDAVISALRDFVGLPVEAHQWEDLAQSAEDLATVVLYTKSMNYSEADAELVSLLDLDVAKGKTELVSPFRRHPEWERATWLLSFGQLLRNHLTRIVGIRRHELDAVPLFVEELSPRLASALKESAQLIGGG
jgi:hypothetical protein